MVVKLYFPVWGECKDISINLKPLKKFYLFQQSVCCLSQQFNDASYTKWTMKAATNEHNTNCQQYAMSRFRGWPHRQIIVIERLAV